MTAIHRFCAAWYASTGTESSKGTKVFALGGNVQHTGLVEVPIGMQLGELIYEVGGGIPGGKDFKAAQLGGPSGGTPEDHELDELDELDKASGEGLGKKEESEIKELDQWDKSKDIKTEPEPTQPSTIDAPNHTVTARTTGHMARVNAEATRNAAVSAATTERTSRARNRALASA